MTMNVIETMHADTLTLSQQTHEYPVDLNQQEIERLIPHRGDILFARRMRLLGAERYLGFITWDATSIGIAGHFPMLSIIPAVYLIEAAAQVAGAGMMAVTTELDQQSDERIGVLAGVRRCVFSKPVLPAQEVRFDMNVRQGSGGFMFAKGSAEVAGTQVASFDLIVAFVDKRLIFPDVEISAQQSQLHVTKLNSTIEEKFVEQD